MIQAGKVIFCSQDELRDAVVSHRDAVVGLFAPQVRAVQVVPPPKASNSDIRKVIRNKNTGEGKDALLAFQSQSRTVQAYLLKKDAGNPLPGRKATFTAGSLLLEAHVRTLGLPEQTGALFFVNLDDKKNSIAIVFLARGVEELFRVITPEGPDDFHAEVQDTLAQIRRDFRHLDPMVFAVGFPFLEIFRLPSDVPLHEVREIEGVAALPDHSFFYKRRDLYPKTFALAGAAALSALCVVQLVASSASYSKAVVTYEKTLNEKVKKQTEVMTAKDEIAAYAAVKDLPSWPRFLNGLDFFYDTTEKCPATMTSLEDTGGGFQANLRVWGRKEGDVYNNLVGCEILHQQRGYDITWVGDPSKNGEWMYRDIKLEDMKGGGRRDEAEDKPVREIKKGVASHPDRGADRRDGPRSQNLSGAASSAPERRNQEVRKGDEGVFRGVGEAVKAAASWFFAPSLAYAAEELPGKGQLGDRGEGIRSEGGQDSGSGAPVESLAPADSGRPEKSDRGGQVRRPQSQENGPARKPAGTPSHLLRADRLLTSTLSDGDAATAKILRVENEKLQEELAILRQDYEAFLSKNAPEIEKKKRERTDGAIVEPQGYRLVSLTPSQVVMVDASGHYTFFRVGESIQYEGVEYVLEKIDGGRRAVFQSSPAVELKQSLVFFLSPSFQQPVKKTWEFPEQEEKTLSPGGSGGSGETVAEVNAELPGLPGLPDVAGDLQAVSGPALSAEGRALQLISDRQGQIEKLKRLGVNPPSEER